VSGRRVFQSETCAFFQTSIEFRSTLQAQHDDDDAKANTNIRPATQQPRTVQRPVRRSRDRGVWRRPWTPVQIKLGEAGQPRKPCDGWSSAVVETLSCGRSRDRVGRLDDRVRCTCDEVGAVTRM
jgi:hypothetical protein